MELGMLAVALVALLTAFFLWYPWYLKRHPGRRPGTSSAQSGLVRGMDEIWHPEAVAPAQARDDETRWVEPAPTPDPERPVLDGGIRAAVQRDLDGRAR
jgi:hypothetical protein